MHFKKAFSAAAAAVMLSYSSVPYAYSSDKLIAGGYEHTHLKVSLPDMSGFASDGKLVSFVAYDPMVQTQVSAAEFPVKYDMREHGAVSSMKDQGSYGTCWAYTSAASAESSIIGSVPDVDLSEMHTAFYSFYDPFSGDIMDMDVQDILNKGGMVRTGKRRTTAL